MLKTPYEIKIFVVHDHNITKTNTHAPDANHHKELTKAAKRGIKKHTLSTNAHDSKMLPKTIRNQDFRVAC